MRSVSTAKITKNAIVENSAWWIGVSGFAAYADPLAPKVDAVARRNSTQLRGIRIVQSPRRTSTNKPVKNMLKAMQLASAIIAGLKSDAATAVCGACRAL
jgi:hypothetical protein